MGMVDERSVSLPSFLIVLLHQAGGLFHLFRAWGNPFLLQAAGCFAQELRVYLKRCPHWKMNGQDVMDRFCRSWDLSGLVAGIPFLLLIPFKPCTMQMRVSGGVDDGAPCTWDVLALQG